MKKQGYGRAPEGYDWYEMLRRYMEYKKTCGHNPRCSGGSKEETQLYYWMYNQTRLIINGHISDEHYYALIQAGADIPNRGNLYERYMANVQKCSKKAPQKGDSLYKWMVNQFNENRALCDWQVQAWKDAGITIEMVGESNQKWYERFLSYKAALSGDGLSCNDVKWINIQIKNLNSNKIASWKRDKLSTLGICENTEPINVKGKYASIWESHVKEYYEFVQKNGRKPSQSRKEEKFLYFWRCCEIKAIRRGSRNKAQIKTLENLGIAA